MNLLQPSREGDFTLACTGGYTREYPTSKEVADRFVEALRKLEEDQDMEALVEIHAEKCEVGNVAVPGTFSGHDGLREFWTSYRETFDEMKSEFRNVFADDTGHAALE